MQVPFPDYSRSLVNLTSCIAENFHAPDMGYQKFNHQALDGMSGKRNLILLVIDGLGDEYVQEHPGFFRNNRQTRLTSVFPSTTASSITTLLTGQAPQQHGITGWFVYLEEVDEVTAVLPFRPRGSDESLSSRGINIEELYGHRSLFDLLDTRCYVVSPDWILESEFNRCHTASSTGVPYSSLEGMCHSICELAGDDEQKYIYAYWAEFDHLSHKYGNNSDVVSEHYVLLERAVEEMSRKLKDSNTLLIITADHGFIDTTPDRQIIVNDYPHMHECLRHPLCGEPRLAYCYLHENKMEQFTDFVQQEFYAEMECIKSDEFIDRGVFGQGEPHPQLHKRVGDYVLVMKDNFVIKDWLPGEKKFFHYGVHGGNSTREINIPLIVIEP